MGEYIFTGRNSRGKKVTECIDAESANDAVRLLSERGYLEIVLHTEDVGALYTRSRQFASYVSPREFVRYRSLTERGYFLYMVGKLYRTGWLVELAAVAFLVFRWKLGRPFGSFDILAIVILVLPVVFALAP